MKITFIFIVILFVDSVNRVYRVQVELAEAKKSQAGYEISPHQTPRLPSSKYLTPSSSPILGHERMEVQARKFYSQRNMYLCGFTLFLSLILNRTYTMILEVLRLEERVNRYEAINKTGGKDSDKLERAGNAGEIGKLKNLLAQKDRDIETLKEQSARNKQFSDDILDKAQANEPSAGSRKEK